MSGYQNKMYIEKRCFMNFLPCPFIFLSLSLCRSICLCVCVCVSLYSPLSCSLSHTSLYYFLSSYLYLLLYLPIAPREYICLSLSTYLSPSLHLSLPLSPIPPPLSPSHKFISLLPLYPSGSQL